MILHRIDELPRQTLWYLATPYSKWPHGLDDACQVAQMLTGQLLLQKVAVYSPIAEMHGISKFISSQVDPRDNNFWLDADKPKFLACGGLLVADLPGWRISEGVAKEIKWARELKRQAWLLRPESLDYCKLPL